MRMRDTFLTAGYHVAEILKATKAGSMSEFIFVESRADQLERGLLETSEESNPMQPERDEPRTPGELVDLVRIFLLHRILPLSRLVQILGAEDVELMLRLRMIQAIEGEGCAIVPPERSVAAVAADSMCCGAFFACSNVAVWPVEEDLLICTDFEQTYSGLGLEPVMYISEDSLALVCGASRVKANSVLDLCCGSGIQGIVALRHYAERATFVDLNPRALRFTRLNLAFNGLAHRADGFHLGSLYNALPLGVGPFDAIVANPPFVPNPLGIASGAGAMFGDGGDTGERVLASIVQGAPRYIAPGGRLSTVSMAPNVEGLPARVEGWYQAGAAEVAPSAATQGFEAFVFRGPPTEADRYQPTSTPAETQRYQATLRRMGITTLSECLIVLAADEGPESPGPRASIAGQPRPDLWSDHMFLRLVVQRALAKDLDQPAFAAPQSAVYNAPSAAQPAASPAYSPPPTPAPPKPQRAAPAAASPPKPQRAPAAPAAPPVPPAPPTPPTPAPKQAPPDRSREGWLPGFQPGFFPAHCSGCAAPEWEPTAEELGRIAAKKQLASAK